ncbi:LysR family transcriptional regulator [Cellulomonas sp. McL0617]|uniref:LysR family transcriptional regulator n=1 Tax=Cellulomonas sp. McL0617 TaxID=3415675 RepID=UPI003CEB2BE4
MDPRALETLRTIGSQGGVTAAAAVLHLTPSAVSQQMAVLQRETGVALTERVGRGLRLTPAGEALAAAAEDVAVALERAQAACAAFLERPEGIVRVSAFQSGAELLLPGLLARVGALRGIVLECTDEDVAQEDFAALTDRIDVVVAHRPEGAPVWPGVQVVPLLREPLDVAVPLDHPLAGRASIRPVDLAGADWISVRDGFPIASLVREVVARSGAPARIVHRVNDFHVTEAFVAAGHGIALLPRYTFGGSTRIRLVPLAEVLAGRRIDALLRRDRAERLVVRRVVHELQSVAAAIATLP